MANDNYDAIARAIHAPHHNRNLYRCTCGASFLLQHSLRTHIGRMILRDNNAENHRELTAPRKSSND